MTVRSFSSLTLAVVFLTAAQVSARVAAPLPLYERLARADVVVAGKVDSIEDKRVVLPDKSEYHIAVIKITDPLLNAKGLTHIRVGIRATADPLPATWAVDQDLLLLLSQKPGQTFYVAPLRFDVVVKSNAEQFAKEVAEAKRLSKLLADPDAALKSKDQDERLMTAAMLLTRYRTVKEGQTKQEPIDAAQSKLILQVIADADWDKKPEAGQPTPQLTFAKLGLTKEQDGWMPPKEFKDFPEAARGWIKKNADTYRILKHVAEKKD